MLNEELALFEAGSASGAVAENRSDITVAVNIQAHGNDVMRLLAQQANAGNTD